MSQLSDKLQMLLEQAVAANEIAGANLLLLRDGREIAYAEAGYADRAAKKSYKRDTISRLYSMTKPVTAAAAMILMERGMLDLAQPVEEVIPAFRGQQVWDNGVKVPARRPVQVKDLLSMTSGLPYPGEGPAAAEAGAVFGDMDDRLYGEAPMDTMELAQRLGRCALAFHPGDSWMYGSSADILGAVIGKVSGVGFGTFLQKEIFAPLGMKDTGFYVPPEKQSRLAQVYQKTQQGLELCQTNNLGIRYPQDCPPAFESGGAGLVSTLDDYAKFAQMLLKYGYHAGRQILRPQTVRYMTGGKLLPWQQEALWRSWDNMAGYGYGNLMRIMEEPGMAQFNTWKGEYGWDGWLGCYFCNSPVNGVTMVLTCQAVDAGTLALVRRLRNVIAAYI